MITLHGGIPELLHFALLKAGPTENVGRQPQHSFHRVSLVRRQSPADCCNHNPACAFCESMIWATVILQP